MATKKKVVKVRDLKPSKDAKGGVSLNTRQPAAWTAVVEQLDSAHPADRNNQGRSDTRRLRGPIPRGGFIFVRLGWQPVHSGRLFVFRMLTAALGDVTQ